MSGDVANAKNNMIQISTDGAGFNASGFVLTNWFEGDDRIDIIGTSAVETLVGTSGPDSIFSPGADDVLIGGQGSDIYRINSNTTRIGELPGEGTDLVETSASYIMDADVENVLLTGAAGSGVAGNDLANVITGNTGGNGITGGLGNDTINAGAGTDTIDGGFGDDSMSGGTGIDVYFVDSVLDVVTETFEAGVFDTIWTTVSLTLPTAVEIVILNGGTLAINATGNDGDSDDTPNLMLGNNAANLLTTFAGDDIILGLDGNDTITTGVGSAAGVEIISGGLGNDTLTSGGGHDFFTYESITEGGDTITDFVTTGGNDLDIVDLRPLFPSFTNTVGVTTVAQAVASGHLTFTQAGADTQAFADANGGADDDVLLAILSNTTAAAVQLLTLI